MIASIDSSKIKKILIFTLSNLGDVILNTPVISVLREHFPNSSLSVLTGPKGVSIFSGSRMIDELWIYDKQASLFEKFKLVFQLRKKKFDLVVDLRNSAVPFLVGSKYRTSYVVDRSALSMRERHLARIRFLLPVENCKNHFDFFSESEKQSALNQLNSKLPGADSFIVLAPGAGHWLKRWTISGFVDVMNHFLGGGRNIVLLGWDLERELGEELERNASRPIADFIGELSLRESAGLISQAALVIANDSAIMHLAHELDRPTVSIFGPTNEEKYGQTGDHRRTVRLKLDCTPCESSKCRLERRACLDDLSPADVIQASEELLDHAAHPTFKH